MKIFDLLNELLEEADRSRRRGMGSKATVDTDKVFGILQEIRQALPNEIVEAQKIVESRQRIILQAKEDAEDIRTSAEGQVQSAVDGSRVMRKAREDADRLVREAKKDAYKIRMAANDYAVDVIDDLTAYIDEYRSIVQVNRADFVGRMHRESEEL